MNYIVHTADKGKIDTDELSQSERENSCTTSQIDAKQFGRHSGEWMKISHSKRLVAITAAAAITLSFAGNSKAVGNVTSSRVFGSGERYMLHLHHLHTGETLDIVYRVGDTYIPGAMEKLNYFLRDHRTNDVSHYDPKEFDLLHSVMSRLGKPNSVIDVVCGYRTPWSNNFLRTRSAVTGVAKNSQHMEAKAIDIRVAGVTTSKLRDIALALHGGGVGYYPASHFVHVDVGPVRRWTFGGSAD